MRFFIFISVLILSSTSIAKESYEVGIGTNYGGAGGVTINSELNSNIDIFAGIGVGLEKAAFVLGAKYWLNDNIRSSFNYTTNCTVYRGGVWRDYQGFNAGVGYAWGGKESGWALDAMLLDISECNKAESAITSNHAPALALGYRF